MADRPAPPLAATGNRYDWHANDPDGDRAIAEVDAMLDEFAFVPVPVRPRADGWTAAKQEAFLRWLGTLGSVAEAAAMVGMSAAGAYRLRQRAGAARFASAWDCALLHAGEDLLARSIRRAVDGTAIPTIHGHRITRIRRVYDNALLIKLMTHVAGRTARRHRRVADRQKGLL